MTLGELLARGGWAMIPIYVCSIATVAVFLQKFAQLRSARLDEIAWLTVVIERLDSDAHSSAMDAASSARHPAGAVIAAMLATAQHKPERAEAEAGRHGSLALQQLERRMGVLAFVAQVAPLLGLLGTVVGLVGLFMDMEGGAAATSGVLSAGIWSALLTTAAGLIVAVVALAGHAYLTSRVDGLRLFLHDAVEQVLTAQHPETADGDEAREL